MKKTITKKVKAPKKETKQIVSSEKFDYKVEVGYNGKRFGCETNDLFEALSSIAPKLPEYIKTRLEIKVTKGNHTIDKILLLGQAKLFFRNPLTRKMFIKNLYFK
jgi:hypothetical protein